MFVNCYVVSYGYYLSKKSKRLGGEEDVAFFIIGDFFEENGVVQDLGDFVRKVFFKQNLFNGIKDDEGCKKNELL